MKTVLCVLGALGCLFIATSEASADIPCDSLLSGGVPLEQCLGEYVCHNGTCGERFDKLIACILQTMQSLFARCFPELSLSQDDFASVVQPVSMYNATFCSGQYWNISSYVASQLDTAGKCTERFEQEYAECSRSFLQKFLTESSSAEALCREYQRSLQCVTELSQSECCFNQSEQAILFGGTESNSFCQCVNVTSSDLAMATERPNIMTSVVPFSRGCPTGHNMPKSTVMPTSSSTAVSSSRLILFAKFMIINFVVSLVP